MSSIKKIVNDDWTDKFDQEVYNVKLQINIFKTLQKKAIDQCRLKQIPAKKFGPRRSEKADHIESKGGGEESNESSWKNDDLH